MSGGRSIVLEIYGLKGGRWNIHANYSVQQREECLEAAKDLDSKGRFEAVCVVRETYSESDNTARQAVIYHSPTLSSPPPVATVTEGAGKPKPAAAPSAPREAAQADGAWRKKEDKKKPAKAAAAPGAKTKTKAKATGPVAQDGPTLADVLPRLLTVAAAALMGALTLAYIAYVVIQTLQSVDIVLGKTMSQSIIISVFLLGFIFIFIPLLKRYVPTIQSSGRQRTQFAAAHPAPAPAIDLPPAGGIDGDQDAGPAEKNMSGSPAPADEFEDSDFGEDDPADEAAAESEEQEAAEKSSDKETARTLPKKDDKPDVSAEMLKFIRDSLEPLAKAGHPLNAFNRFGLTLFFAGAGEYLATRYKLSEKEITDILCAHVQILGHNAEMARGFCANIDEYLVNPKYFQMYERGRSAFATLSAKPDSKPPITEAIEEWSSPAKVTAKSDKEFVAVLFTDIVGSTAMTQERGDDAAQLVVREHNRIVREALALHGGKEIKHTGDGIMATFSQISNAVEGAVAMQEACRRANDGNPDLGLGLCIGVNAGEPIHEDGDIFGTPVQMAARVLSKAEGDEIAVSNLVKEMCSGKSFEFSKKGDYELKGFAEPVPIFLVDWQRGLHAPEKSQQAAS